MIPKSPSERDCADRLQIRKKPSLAQATKPAETSLDNVGSFREGTHDLIPKFSRVSPELAPELRTPELPRTPGMFVGPNREELLSRHCRSPATNSADHSTPGSCERSDDRAVSQ
jgi:hypothetical protein